MSDVPATPSVVTQIEALPSLVEAEIAKIEAAKAKAFHALVAEFGIRAVYLAMGAVGFEISRVIFFHVF